MGGAQCRKKTGLVAVLRPDRTKLVTLQIIPTAPTLFSATVPPFLYTHTHTQTIEEYTSDSLDCNPHPSDNQYHFRTEIEKRIGFEQVTLSNVVFDRISRNTCPSCIINAKIRKKKSILSSKNREKYKNVFLKRV